MAGAAGTKYIFVTGGVVSSLGKGIATSSLGVLLQEHGYKVRLRKLDPYLNVDPGTMSPYQHGEVFVTDDGAETDLDLGHYERFTEVDARRGDNITSGRIYSEVIARERKGDYLGATIQVIPHVTDAIKEFITTDSSDVDFMLCEIGGTVGDIESLPFLEAIRQLRNELGAQRTLFIHLTLMPWLQAAGELKTKPTQHSVKELLSVGIQPDILLCRSEKPIPPDARAKIGLFCNIRKEAVIAAPDVSSIYEVPLALNDQGFDAEVLKCFDMPLGRPDLAKWIDLNKNLQIADKTVNVAIVGKYTEMVDSYKSLSEALTHACVANGVKLQIDWLDAGTHGTDIFEQHLADADCILVPGGFGERGVKGKLRAIEYARTHNKPFLGICLGMQLAVVEAATNVARIPEAGSTEFNPEAEPLVGLMTQWQSEDGVQRRVTGGQMGGTMRLGAYECLLEKGSHAHNAYGADAISERHRHRYEVNIDYKLQLESAGLQFTGMSPDGQLPEIVEWKNHPWFVGVQFHPELKSRPHNPHPLFVDYIKSALN